MADMPRDRVRIYEKDGRWYWRKKVVRFNKVIESDRSFATRAEAERDLARKAGDPHAVEDDE